MAHRTPALPTSTNTPDFPLNRAPARLRGMIPKRNFVAEFKDAYHEEFGEVISDGEALERLTRLTNMLRAITTENSPDPWEEDAGQPPSFDSAPGNDTLKP